MSEWSKSPAAAAAAADDKLQQPTRVHHKSAG
jgi:hypothetical protein